MQCVPGGPADLSKQFQTGDCLVTVDGKAVKTLGEASPLISGQVGTEVSFGLVRDKEELTVRIVRGIPVSSKKAAAIEPKHPPAVKRHQAPPHRPKHESSASGSPKPATQQVGLGVVLVHEG